MVRKILKEEYTLNIKRETNQKKENGLINTIKVLFDGEEVRK
jgi:hypothetical protein